MIKYKSVTQVNNEVYLDGDKVDIPAHVRRKSGCNSTIINGKVFINGYELTSKGKWRRTLRALWNLWF